MGRYDGFKEGDKVQLKKPEMCYGYKTSPPYDSLGIYPHAIGTVGAVKVPYIYRQPGDYPYFLCVDFIIDGQRRRVGASYKNVKKVKHANPD